MTALLLALTGCSSQGSDATSWWVWTTAREDAEAVGACFTTTSTGTYHELFEVWTLPEGAGALSYGDSVLLGTLSEDEGTFGNSYQEVDGNFTERYELVVTLEFEEDGGQATLVTTEFAGFDNDVALDCVTTRTGPLVRAEPPE
jgi:hypothetical protein